MVCDRCRSPKCSTHTEDDWSYHPFSITEFYSGTPALRVSWLGPSEADLRLTSASMRFANTDIGKTITANGVQATITAVSRDGTPTLAVIPPAP